MCTLRGILALTSLRKLARWVLWLISCTLLPLSSEDGSCSSRDNKYRDLRITDAEGLAALNMALHWKLLEQAEKVSPFYNNSSDFHIMHILCFSFFHIRLLHNIYYTVHFFLHFASLLE
jgi:hypothetical protein